MKALIEKIRQSVPTLVVFQHKGEKDEEDVDRIIGNLRAKFGASVDVESIDASRNGEYKAHYKLTSYPTYILFKEGQELMRESGHRSEARLEDMVATVL